ncbi:unnamed protein product [Linum trigynum]
MAETSKNAKIARRADGDPAGISDRLSSLPDEILSSILSLLPTKYAAGTSVLSRRWKDLYTEITNIDLDNTLVHKPLSKQLACENMPPDAAQKYLQRKNLTGFEASMYRMLAMSILSHIRHSRYLKFSRFIDNVLLEHKNLNSVRRFRLHFWVKKLESNLKPQLWFYWFEKAVTPSSCELEELDVRIEGDILELPNRMICIDECFYALKNLKVMKLHGVIVETTPHGSASLPSLKVLQLTGVKTVDCSESVSRLISGCPVLETLHLENCSRLKSRMMTDKEKDMLVVYLPSLRNLTIIGCVGYDVTLVCPIVVQAPSLQHLHLQDFAELRFLDSQSPCLVSAQIDIGESQILDQCLIRFLAQISNAKRMYLSSQTMCLLSAAVKEDVQLPVFPNLTHLILGTAGSSCCLLHSLLNSATKLQTLVIHLGCDKEEAMKWESEPACLPQCLVSSLEEIEINDLVADENEMKMATYLLNAGAKLKIKKVNNTCLPPGDGLDIKDGNFTHLAQLLNLPRGSNDEVEGDNDDEINFTDEIEYKAEDNNTSEEDDEINIDDEINNYDDYDLTLTDLLFVISKLKN